MQVSDSILISRVKGRAVLPLGSNRRGGVLGDIFPGWIMRRLTFVLLLLLPLLALRDSAIAQGGAQRSSLSGATQALFIRNGGRVAWYHGDKHELIAYDSVSDTGTKNTAVYTIDPDGTGRSCVTCSSSIPKGFVGNPDWYPDGEHLVVMAENSNSKHGLFNHMAWGLDNDLWIIRRDGTGAERIWSSTKPGSAVLHPHFNRDGTKMVFAERFPTGKKIARPLLRRLLPGGENPWTGWHIHLADVNMSRSGTGKLTNHREILPNGEGFYETHGFTSDGRITYTFTPGGLAYEDDVYMANLDGTGVVNLTKSSSTWDEHGQFSPSGKYFAFMSSRYDPSLRYPKAKATELVTELYIQEGNNPPVQVTHVNQLKKTRTVVSDFAWDASGKRIIFQVANLRSSEPPDLWILTLP